MEILNDIELKTNTQKNENLRYLEKSHVVESARVLLNFHRLFSCADSVLFSRHEQRPLLPKLILVVINLSRRVHMHKQSFE